MNDAEGRIAMLRQCLSSIRILEDAGVARGETLTKLYINLVTEVSEWTENDVRAFIEERERIGKAA